MIFLGVTLGFFGKSYGEQLEERENEDFKNHAWEK